MKRLYQTKKALQRSLLQTSTECLEGFAKVSARLEIKKSQVDDELKSLKDNLQAFQRMAQEEATETYDRLRQDYESSMRGEIKRLKAVHMNIIGAFTQLVREVSSQEEKERELIVRSQAEYLSEIVQLRKKSEKCESLMRVRNQRINDTLTQLVQGVSVQEERDRALIINLEDEHFRGIEQLHKEREEFEVIKEQMRAISVNLKEIVKLNIRGRIFETTKEILLRFPNSLLGRLVNWKEDIGKDENGAYFFDSDAEVFQYILHYIRYGCVKVPKELVETYNEGVEFYGLPSECFFSNLSLEVAFDEAQLIELTNRRPLEDLVIDLFAFIKKFPGAKNKNGWNLAMSIAKYIGEKDAVIAERLLKPLIEKGGSHLWEKNNNHSNLGMFIARYIGEKDAVIASRLLKPLIKQGGSRLWEKQKDGWNLAMFIVQHIDGKDVVMAERLLKPLIEQGGSRLWERQKEGWNLAMLIVDNIGGKDAAIAERLLTPLIEQGGSRLWDKQKEGWNLAMLIAQHIDGKNAVIADRLLTPLIEQCCSHIQEKDNDGRTFAMLINKGILFLDLPTRSFRARSGRCFRMSQSFWGWLQNRHITICSVRRLC